MRAEEESWPAPLGRSTRGADRRHAPTLEPSRSSRTTGRACVPAVMRQQEARPQPQQALSPLQMACLWRQQRQRRRPRRQASAVRDWRLARRQRHARVAPVESPRQASRRQLCRHDPWSVGQRASFERRRLAASRGRRRLPIRKSVRRNSPLDGRRLSAHLRTTPLELAKLACRARSERWRQPEQRQWWWVTKCGGARQPSTAAAAARRHGSRRRRSKHRPTAGHTPSDRWRKTRPADPE